MANNPLVVDVAVGTLLEIPTNGDGPVLAQVAPPGAAPIPLATTPPVNVTAAAAQVGVGTSSARADHKHDVDTATPVNVALANAAGASSALSRADHVHAFAANLISSAYAAAWAVTDWYIDGTTGDDANNGTTSGTPLRTGAELARRLGPYALWGQSVTVHVLANGMTDALILRGVMLVAGSHLDVVGTPTQLATDIVGSYAPLNHATPTATQITGTAIVDFSPYAFRRIRNTTAGARFGTVSWVATANPGGAGVATARISPPVQVNQTSASNNTSAQVFAAGDTFAVESLPTVPSLALFLDGPILQTAGAAYDRRQFSIADLTVTDLQITSTANSVAYKSLLFGCALEHLLFQQSASVVTFVSPVGCWLSSNDGLSTSTKRIIAATYVSCLFGGGSGPYVQFSLSGANTSLSGVLSQGKSLNVSSSNSSISNVQVFDLPGASNAALILQLGPHSLVNVSGSGNAGFGVSIQNGAIVGISSVSPLNLLGAVSNARLLTPPAVNLTLAQAQQPDDFAQKGITPAMVAGATTVTVPWYDNTTQQVTVSHAAFAGTPGVLSVQQISNTQFTITSSSNLDTSTVRWQISPLGRNIFTCVV